MPTLLLLIYDNEVLEKEIGREGECKKAEERMLEILGVQDII